MDTKLVTSAGNLSYQLEIYPAGEAGPEPRRKIVASTPFIPPRAGELINPGGLGLPELDNSLLRVVNVEHRLIPREGGWVQAVAVYTRKVCDNRGVRIFNPSA